MNTRSTHIVHRTNRAAPPVAVTGRGLEIVDGEGRCYLDACGGAAVSSLGHGNPAVIEAINDQLRRIEYAHTSFFSSEPAELLADLLISMAPRPLNHVYFTGSGSEAVEAALKLARQYHLERGAHQRQRVIYRRQSYHGNTLGALAVSGNARQQGYEPLLFDATQIAPCFEYHYAEQGESTTSYSHRTADALESELLRVGPENVMAFVAETVVGATAGAVPATHGYFKRIREICDRYDILLILDEVMCGAGRTGTFLACEQEGIVPDIVTLAKGLAAGYQPIGALIVTTRLYDAVTTGSGAVKQGQTYNAHPVACAAALAVQGIIRDEGLLERVCTAGHYFRQKLVARFDTHPHVGDIRGRGLLQAVEIVSDRDTRRSFAPANRISALIKAKAFDQGLLVYPGSGTVDGIVGDHILFAPPFICRDDELDEIVQRFARALDNSLRGS